MLLIAIEPIQDEMHSLLRENPTQCRVEKEEEIYI